MLTCKKDQNDFVSCAYLTSLCAHTHIDLMHGGCRSSVTRPALEHLLNLPVKCTINVQDHSSYLRL